MKTKVVRGPHAVVAMEQEVVQEFFLEKSGDPAQVVEQLEERLLEEEG